MEQQQEFAVLSADFNPMHIDPVLARRLISGRPVVHGIHSLLWALDDYLQSRTEKRSLLSLEAVFQKPLDVDTRVRCTVVAEEEGQLELELETHVPVARICCRFGGQVAEVDLPRAPARESLKPVVCRAEDLADKCGKLELFFDVDAATRMFPTLVACLPALQIAEILATSRLVGMECPGLHSVYSELGMKFDDCDSMPPRMEFRVKKFDRRFGLTMIEAAAPGAKASIKAFLRPQPQEQLTCTAAREAVVEDEFKEQCALVVGGSRGLGEVSAKLLAAGGARVIVTYYQGAEDAQRLVDDIREQGGQAEAIALDVTDAGAGLDTVEQLDTPLSHLYYFATPFIFSGNRGVLSAELFGQFSAYYVTGFIEVAQVMLEKGVNDIFYPSTVALDERPPDMGEYIAAKAAGEALCEVMEASHDGLFVYRPRLPRLATDQTLSFLPVNNQEPAPEILRHLRVFARRGTDG
jgi:hypothetical protein